MVYRYKKEAAGEVILQQPLPQVRRQQQLLVAVTGEEVPGHRAPPIEKTLGQSSLTSPDDKPPAHGRSLCDSLRSGAFVEVELSPPEVNVLWHSSRLSTAQAAVLTFSGRVAQQWGQGQAQAHGEATEVASEATTQEIGQSSSGMRFCSRSEAARRGRRVSPIARCNLSA